MTPPCHRFPVAQLPQQIQSNAEGRKRKTASGKDIDLNGCELVSLLQYKCRVENPEQSDSPVRCYELEKLFRRCTDKKGSFMVETTAWEGAPSSAAASPADAAATAKNPRPPATTTWHDANRTNYYPSD
ncbi:hypothetical protein BD289DRAFT_377785 [Coniella lustricola]|uniref:Uncharacterized protein n=1 Tax=Coniella lustricola TaxID=2025994 RepID=A0A2T2ZV02_9PEZI|nr:hypothetical protein BD289DRAFT_377785 [Coniella lustricola]